MESKSADGGIVSLVAIIWDKDKWTFSVTLSAWVLLGMLALIAAMLAWRFWFGGSSFKDFEIDQTEVGVGQNKIRFKPNLTDRQVAYAIWVELSTRKIGLPINFEDDVVCEVYDSWYNFFTVTRELIKTIPVTQMRHGSTRSVVNLSVEILNDGIRPHLTCWQARFRRWYDHELGKRSDDGAALIEPQELQKKFPKFDELKMDMERVNNNLIRYRQKMRQLAFKE